MQAILIGNGYDLNLGLPTRYMDFLNTASFLLENRAKRFTTLGDIFANQFFDDKDKIKSAYTRHKKAYDDTEINQETINEIIECLDDNLWYKYFYSSFYKDLKWIDFEKEIRTVVNSFQELFECGQIKYYRKANTIPFASMCIINSFNMFDGSINISSMLKSEYLLQYPMRSGNYIIDREKIIQLLLSGLDKLSLALSLYMKCFVDDIIDKLDSASLDYKDYFSDIAITLNYTHTYEKLLENDLRKDADKRNNVYHVHGEVGKKIVLGINQDSADFVETANPIFAPFKKYFQRVMYRTDVEYMSFLKANNEMTERLNLFVMGHSLDITDKDIISELFNIANTITIYYHSEKSMADMIKNLITIFGVKKFNDFRLVKDLQFIKMDDKEAIRLNWFSQSINDDLL